MISATLSHTLTTSITYHGLAICSRSLELPGGNRTRTDEREEKQDLETWLSILQATTTGLMAGLPTHVHTSSK